jgi:hypothetical protein
MGHRSLAQDDLSTIYYMYSLSLRSCTRFLGVILLLYYTMLHTVLQNLFLSLMS